MRHSHIALACGVLCELTLVVAAHGAAWADGRRRTEQRELTPQPLLLPAAAAPASLTAPVLSGLDYTAIAPPGLRLRVIEDEPYVYTLGSTGTTAATGAYGTPPAPSALSAITLHAGVAGDGWYEARISLRAATDVAGCRALAESFDAAANAAYARSLTAVELRSELAYSLYEVRSPLGLTDAKDRANRWREYMAYATVVEEPLGPPTQGVPGAVADVGAALQTATATSAEGSTAPPAAGYSAVTPYAAAQGELRVLRRAGRQYYLLTIGFESSHFANGLTLTENVARCIVNRILAVANADAKQYLPYLAYYPEYEPFVAAPGEARDARVADLAEQPGEGCGTDAQPITGDVCPECGGPGPFWPAAPYGDAQHSAALGQAGADAKCSHCLLQPAAADEEWFDAIQDAADDPAGCIAPAARDACASLGEEPAGECHQRCHKLRSCPNCRPKCRRCADGKAPERAARAASTAIAQAMRAPSR